jgi:hypothetical protein
MGDSGGGRQGIEPAGDGYVSGEKGRLIRIPDLADDIPVGTAGGQGERSPGSDADEPPFGVEEVEKGDEVVLVGTAPV